MARVGPRGGLPPVSGTLSIASAFYLGTVGIVLLFASDALVPRLLPGVGRSGAWLGQLLAAAWLGAAMLNWNGRTNVLGGIYGRPQVNLNLMLYLIGGLSLLQAPTTPLVLWMFTVPMGLLALAYAAVFLRGPFDSLA